MAQRFFSLSYSKMISMKVFFNSVGSLLKNKIDFALKHHHLLSEAVNKSGS